MVKIRFSRLAAFVERTVERGSTALAEHKTRSVVLPDDTFERSPTATDAARPCPGRSTPRARQERQRPRGGSAGRRERHAPSHPPAAGPLLRAGGRPSPGRCAQRSAASVRGPLRVRGPPRRRGTQARGGSAPSSDPRAVGRPTALSARSLRAPSADSTAPRPGAAPRPGRPRPTESPRRRARSFSAPTGSSLVRARHGAHVRPLGGTASVVFGEGGQGVALAPQEVPIEQLAPVDEVPPPSSSCPRRTRAAAGPRRPGRSTSSRQRSRVRRACRRPLGVCMDGALLDFFAAVLAPRGPLGRAQGRRRVARRPQTAV